MTVLQKNLENLRQKIERNSKSIEALNNQKSRRERGLETDIDEYNLNRAELFLEELERRKLTWCTECKSCIPVSESQLMVFTGLEEVSGGYENGDWGLRERFECHRLCEECQEKAMDHHGQTGKTCSFTHKQAVFYAFKVKKEGNIFFTKKFGEWQKIKFDDDFPVPEALMESSAAEFKLPPKIEARELAA